MNLRKLIIILFLSILITQPISKVYAADLYAIIVGDTKDPSIGISAGKDLTNIQKELKYISKYTKLNLNTVVLKGQFVTLQNLIVQLDTLNPGPQDVVILYFSQHGFRTPSKVNQWPNLSFGPSDNAGDFFLFHEMARNKKPRLLISIADTCNNVIPDEYAPPTLLSKQSPSTADSNKIKKNYSELFLKAKGAIIISGAIPGEFSWSYATQGSVYTLSLIKCLHDEVKKSKIASWESLLINSSSLTQKKMKDANQIQNPQYILDLL